VLAGHAAAVWPADGLYQASLSQTEEFREAYQRAREVTWSRDELEAAWAAAETMRRGGM
jgi:hypothetical protein